ncbi:helix-turn-helix domain-containing protein [Pseudotenacibaculum sp. MALMAid0570]|uniref:helix-turn-helix domain-containing protein n=1 Tax=Pseudotenacibaculum sp. MALMAid0570 TaxID=3143938 RepID=UPI0032DEFE33
MKKSLYSQYILLVFIATFLHFNTIQSQEYRDNFNTKYNQSKDSAKIYSDQLIRSEKLNERAFGHITKGYLLTKEGNYDNAEILFNKGFNEINKIKNENSKSEEKLHALYYYSLYLLEKHNIEKATKKISDGLELSKKLGDAKMQIKFRNLRGRSFSILGLSKEAITNGLETINDIKTLKSELLEPFYNNELLRAYLNTGNRMLSLFLFEPENNEAYLDSTAIYLNTAQQFAEQVNLQPNTIHKRQILNLRADLFYFQGDYKKAIESYKKTLKVSEALGFKKRIYQVKFRLAEAHFHQEEYKKAKEIFDSISLDDLNQYRLLKNSIDIKYYYARIYSKLGDLEKSEKYIDTFYNQADDFYKTLSSTKIDVFTKSQLDKKKQVLNQLQQERKTNLYLTIILASIFLLFTVFIFYTRSQRTKLKSKVESLLKNMEKNEQKSTSNTIVDEAKVQKILIKLKAIEKQKLFLSKDYSLNMVAKKIDSNSSYVSQIINTHRKKSFVQYTNELRINYILQKLKEDEIYQKFTLLAIAESIGYKSLSSFNKHFKVITGITPKQYLQYIKSL